MEFKPSWREVKETRIEILSKIMGKKFCERCFCEIDERDLVGHHTIPKNGHNGNGATILDCQIRCRRCEAEMHGMFKGGNNKETKMIQEQHNAFIVNALFGSPHFSYFLDAT
ncbi:MAG: hypothetical protein HY764_03610 [Candidatus Portnoybacteria bacterium]|nr:hypothetical protein [Candidatus Portnoybacteria bacterium]